MAQSVQITCINKSDRYNPHERILSVGGNGWKLTQQQAIDFIDNRTYDFYVHAGCRTAVVIVAKSQWGHKYLKTVADGEQPDNLLSLPECR